MYVYYENEECSFNNCCSRKEISITYSEFVLVALDSQHANCMPRVAICGLPGFTVFFNFTS
jgi:hypothetical protein